MTHEEIKEHMRIGRKLAEDAGKIALEYFRKPVQVDNKLEGMYYDPVTQADKQIEQELRKGLLEHFPSYAILGEEYGSEGEGDLRWVIDPIDGTRAFISGVPQWGVLLGLMDGDQCLGGIMHQPFLKETFVGDNERSVLYSNGSETIMQSRQDAVIEDAIIFSTHPYLFANDKEHEGFQSISARCRLQRFGGDCYSYCMLAHGCIDLVVEGMLQPYDIIALIPIIEAAGGVITNLDGKSPIDGGTVIAAANPALHAVAMEIMHQHTNA